MLHHSPGGISIFQGCLRSLSDLLLQGKLIGLCVKSVVEESVVLKHLIPSRFHQRHRLLAFNCDHLELFLDPQRVRRNCLKESFVRPV